MKIILNLAFVLTCFITYSQSKKEQIRVLTNRVDSLNLELNAERSDNSQRVEQLNRRVSELEENIRGMEIKLKEKDSEIETNKKQIEELRELINVKSDSLMVLKAEVEKLKPTPKPVVKTNPVVATPSGPYKTVTIGTQVWMKENLNVSTFRNGDPIPEAKTYEEWKAAIEAGQPAWCYYDNDPKNGEKYGKLYNWRVVIDPRGIAPDGYHIPSEAEWNILIEPFLGVEENSDMSELIPDKKRCEDMKSTAGWRYTTGGEKPCPKCATWNSEYRKKTACHTCRDTRYVPAPIVSRSCNGNNRSGFSALPGGCRHLRRSSFVGEHAYWWVFSELESYEGSCVYISLSGLHSDKGGGRGCSIRCIKD